MGMYTEFHFNARLKQDTPENVLEVLHFMTDGGYEPNIKPIHKLFSDGNDWRYMLRTGSEYFDAPTQTSLEGFGSDYLFTKRIVLSIRCNFKNYHDEIEKFLDWIAPYLDKSPGDFLGFYRYEETKNPTLIFMNDVLEEKELIKLLHL